LRTIRSVNVIPKKLKEGENRALATPMSFTGTAVEFDEQLPNAIASFVASHLELKNTLAHAKEEMDAAAKAAQEEARNKAKNNKSLPPNRPGGSIQPRRKNKIRSRGRAGRLVSSTTPLRLNWHPNPKWLHLSLPLRPLCQQRRLYPPPRMMKRTRFWQK
jgi:PRTRC genetic system protein E